MKILLFTHKSDIDGMGNAVLAKIAFKELDYILTETYNLQTEILDYCKTGINYHSYKDLRKMIVSIFGNIEVLNQEYIRNMPGKAAAIGRLLPIPGYGKLIFIFRAWELFMVKN